jgi:hypothetical protein
MLGKYFAGAIWAFPVYDIVKSRVRKTCNKYGMK